MSVKAARIVLLALSALLLGTTNYPFCSGLTQLRKVQTEEADTEGKGYAPPVVSSTDTSSRALADDDGTCPVNQRLVPDNGEEGGYFGYAADVDGDYLIVGATRHDVDDIWNAGKAYIYRRDEVGRWAQPYTLVYDSPSTWDSFGGCVAISGDRALVGAPGDDNDAGQNAGSVHVFVRIDDTSNKWSRETVLTPPSGASSFGSSCALDGNTAVVGAWTTDNYRGSAYVFERDETNGWSGPQELLANDEREEWDFFGWDIAVHGKTAIVGASGDDRDTGSAYIFARDATGSWMEEKKLTAGGGREGDQFGNAVAIQENVAIVGAPGHSRGHGAAYLFVDGQNGWEEERRAVASQAGVPRRGIGGYVAIDGDNVIVGASRDFTAHTAHLFGLDDDDELTLVTRLVFEEATPNTMSISAAAISGSTIVMGSYLYKNDDGVETGGVQTFESCGI